jgi:hypothetical protein
VGLPGGFPYPWEHPRDSAIREVLGGDERAADDLAELRWFAPDELPEQFAFAHCHEVVSAWAAAGR